ncbi:hypothetical protein F444_14848 [Phytophthora nicotianae P1976]|uniref:Uncharacterized protein n=1 Tax=Phytophthora nicotianae P1976 TaxID=1317066 RepID=A0A080ZNT9_PHYNI|nr:hypothetical protein F444_14848 [Phytophthora nicotianae P1976]
MGVPYEVVNGQGVYSKDNEDWMMFLSWVKK